MKYLRTSLVLLLLFVLIAAAWLWFNRPSPVDLARYAPADSVLYVELNNPSEVARAIQQTDVWKVAAPITHSETSSNNKLALMAARAGIGPIDAVLFAAAWAEGRAMSLEQAIAAALEEPSAAAVVPAISGANTAVWKP